MKKFFRQLGTRLPRPSINMVLTIAAVVISLCALVVSFAEVRIMRSQQRANLYPYLKINQHFNSDGYGLLLTNKGIGPARINSFQVHLGDTYFPNWVVLTQNLLPDSLRDSMGWHNMNMSNIQQEIIAPNETVRLVWTLYSPTSRMLLEKIRDLQFRLCYSSLLDEHWIVEDFGIPKSTQSSCQRDEEKEMN